MILTQMLNVAVQVTIVLSCSGKLCDKNCTLALQAPTPVEMVGVQDRFGESGKWKQLLDRHGLNAAGVSDAIGRVLARK